MTVPTIGLVGSRSGLSRSNRSTASRRRTGSGGSSGRSRIPRKIPPKPRTNPPGWWKPPQPDPLPPAPAPGPSSLLALGALVLSQSLWQMLNSRPDTIPPDYNEITGTLPPPGNTVPGTVTITRKSGCNVQVGDYGAAGNVCDPFARNSSVANALSARFAPVFLGAPGGGGLDQWLVTTDSQTTPIVPVIFETAAEGYISLGHAYSVEWSGPNPVPVLPPAPYNPPALEDRKPLQSNAGPPDLLPSRPKSVPPSPLPSGADTGAESESTPVVPPDMEPTNNDGTTGEPAPAPGASSTGAPAPMSVPSLVGAAAGAGGARLSSGVRQLLRSEAQPLDNAGQVPPPQASKATTTSTTAHVVNGKPVEGGSASTNPTQLAQELQRVERKLERLLGRPATDGGNEWPVDIADSLALIRALWDLLTIEQPAAEWTIQAPCDKDTEGAALQLSYEFPAADFLPAALQRLDALADMQAQTIGWRRRMCKGQIPTNNVTITAYEIMPE